jgi:RND family efflux transporter, MFP subunit
MSLQSPTPTQVTNKMIGQFRIKGLTKKILVLSLIALLIIAGVFAASALPLNGKVLTVHSGEFSKGFTEEAQVLSLKEASLFNPVDGKIKALHVENGDYVSKGQLLVELETQDIQNQIDVLKAQLISLEGQRLQAAYRAPQTALIQQQNLLIEQAEKDLLTQEQALERSKALYEAGALPLVEYEEAQRQADKARSFLEQQKVAIQVLEEQQIPVPGTELNFSGQKQALNAQISQLEDKIQRTKLTAPQDGIIKDLTVKAGMVVPSGQLLLTIAQTQGYKLESYVLASDALDIKPGSSVNILQATSSGELLLTGKIKSIAPSASERISSLGLKENRVEVTLLLESNTPVILGSSMDVQFITHQETDCLLVPKTALFPYQGGQALWLVRDGKAIVQPVTKGLENDKETIIEKGLRDGEQVLLDPELPGLKEGKRIKVN